MCLCLSAFLLTQAKEGMVEKLEPEGRVPGRREHAVGVVAEPRHGPALHTREPLLPAAPYWAARDPHLLMLTMV